MENQFRARLSALPRLTRKDIALTLLPGILWIAAIALRPWVVQPLCANDPQSCVQGSISLAIDRHALEIPLDSKSSQADEYSFWTQDLAGAMAVLAPLAVSGLQVSLGSTPVGAAALAATDLVILTQASLMNGFVNEAMHLLTQRPRPFVYSSPGAEGANPAHYTSFYSGHTSFAAVALMCMIMSLLARRAPKLPFAACALSGLVLVAFTGYFRVLAGRHFPTDVIAGAWMGGLIGFLVAYLHRSPGPKIA